MGIEFRGGRYIRRIKLGKRTVKEGEACVIWSRQGQCREVIGPSLEHMFYSTIRFMDRHTAKPGEYVAIEYRDGKIAHHPGPYSIYNNPVQHTAVEVRPCVQLTTPTDCIVVISSPSASSTTTTTTSFPTGQTDHPVYRKQSGAIGRAASDEFAAVAGTAAAAAEAAAATSATSAQQAAPQGKGGPQVNRRIVYGPTNFIPKVNETIVSLSWLMDPSAPMRTAPFTPFTPSSSSSSSSSPPSIPPTAGGASAKTAAFERRHAANSNEPVQFDVVSTRPFRFPAAIPLTTTKGLTLTVELDFGIKITELELAIACGDPVAALWTALQADLARSGPQLAAAYLENQDPSQFFASVDTYEAMASKAKAVGLDVVDVQVKNVVMPAELKRAQDAAMTANARHQAEMDATKRSAEVQRAAAEAKLQRAAQDEQIATAAFAAASRAELHEHQLNTSRQAHGLELEAHRREAQLGATKDEHALLAGFLGQLKAVDVDLTAYLTSMAPAPAPAHTDPRNQVASAAGLDPKTPSARAAARFNDSQTN